MACSFSLKKTNSLSSQSHSPCPFCIYLANNLSKDIEIYRKIGSASYTQLVEHFPGYYNEKYCDYRNNGDSLSYTHFFKLFSSRDQFIFKDGCYTPSSKSVGMPYNYNKEMKIKNGEHSFDDAVPFPPNFISSILIENPFKKPCQIKYFILKEIERNRVNEENDVKKKCEKDTQRSWESRTAFGTFSSFNIFSDMINSSECYNNPVLKYSDIFFISVIITIIIGFFLKCFIR